MVYWRQNGTIVRRELYDLGENPIEEGRDIASENKSKADAMEGALVEFLKSVSAETPKDVPRNRRRTNSGREQD